MRSKLLSLKAELLVLPLLALLINPGKASAQIALPNSGYTTYNGFAFTITNYSTSNISSGILGTSAGGTGVYGYSTNAIGVFGASPSGYGVIGSSTSGYAGYFTGPVYVTGYVYKAGGGFKIDDPIDPARKYLIHSFVESPDMMNIYNGLVVLDAKGEAWVQMPKWFEALNQDFRYQLTGIGGFAPVYIGQEIAGNRFKIAGGKPGMKVSWQVTGIRHDAYANAHRIQVEENKSATEVGYYLHPELYGLGEQKSVAWAQHLTPEQLMSKQQPLANQNLATKGNLAPASEDKDTLLKEQATEIIELQNEGKNMRAELDGLKQQLNVLTDAKRTLPSKPVASR